MTDFPENRHSNEDSRLQRLADKPSGFLIFFGETSGEAFGESLKISKGLPSGVCLSKRKDFCLGVTSLKSATASVRYFLLHIKAKYAFRLNLLLQCY